MPSQPDPNSIMDLDFADFDSWPFDQISASPFFLPASEQPFSPVCAFADFSDDKSAVAAGLRFPPDSRFVTCYPEVPNGNKKDEDVHEDEGDKKTHSRPAFGITRLEVPDMFIIKERMTRALRYFKESTEHHQILAQIWAPIKCGNRYVLTTSGQPFVLSSNSNGLHQYRTVSLMYSFSVDGETDGSLGLPGRVFRQKLPEWTPDVQFYSSKEYPRVKHAKNYNVHGTLALPVFEPSGQSCVGVVELIMTSQKINYAPDVDKVCKALEAVNLRSSKILDHPNIQICNEGRQNALSEILEVLTEVCETYKLPLAQTWVPCRHRSVLAYGGGIKKSCSSFDGSCMEQVSMSTTDVAFYVVDAHMWGFREACAEHHLQKGQGVAGRAFSSRGSCFCEAISRFSKREYPLVHYAKMFELGSSFAICLRSRYTGEDDYVLEFFLPTRLTDSTEQHKLLDAITAAMEQHFQSLMVASGRALQEQRNYLEIVDVSVDESLDSEFEPVPVTKPLTMPGLLNGGVISPSETCKRFIEENGALDEANYSAGAGVSCNGLSSSKVKDTKKPSERKRGKAEKQISLEVLQQYFAGSLKDAAKSLGVCPTTMKRICRQHGISRWPSRKINKVNRSLSKLKCVIESVQGADGAFSLTSISPSSIPVAVGSISWSAFNGSGQLPSPSYKPIDPPASRTQVRDWQAEIANHEINGRASSHEDQVHERSGFGLSRARSGSREASTGTSTSHGSCQGSPVTEGTPTNGRFILSAQAGNSMGLLFQPNRELNSSAPFQPPDSILNARTQDPFGGMLAEDSGSSKDLKDLCSSFDHHTPRPFAPTNATMPRFSSGQGMRSVTVKAAFREDIIRFRFPLSSNILDLRDEVAKRLKLEVGTFEIKYLDDDSEWVLIACDSDLQECLDIMRSSGGSIIRLSIHDVTGNLGSSCESSGE